MTKQVLNEYLRGEPNRQVVETNELMLSGMVDFETAHKEITGKDATDGAIRKYSRTEIIEENRVNFDKIMADTLLPYREVMRAMEATITRREQKLLKRVVTIEGKKHIIDSVESVLMEYPDWPTRLGAVKLYMQLTGHDPRQGITVEINNQQVTANIGNIYAIIGMIENEQDRLTVYNEAKKMERQGHFKLDGNFDIPPIDVPFKEEKDVAT